MMTLKGKVALVTGATRGIGREVALELARAEALVIGTATTDEGAEKITRYLEEGGFSGYGLCMNVAYPETIERTFETIRKNNQIIGILINNAAITRDNIFLRMKLEEWQEVINTNLNAVYHLCRGCIKDMLKARWGRIISLSSVVGVTGNPGQTNYTAAKAALVGFSKSLAQEVATRGITVNLVAPGLIDTDMTRQISDSQRDALLARIPMGRLGAGAEVAHAVGFLASIEASYITGHTLHINGGMVMI